MNGKYFSDADWIRTSPWYELYQLGNFIFYVGQYVLFAFLTMFMVSIRYYICNVIEDFLRSIQEIDKMSNTL